MSGRAPIMCENDPRREDESGGVHAQDCGTVLGLDEMTAFGRDSRTCPSASAGCSEGPNLTLAARSVH